MTSVTSFEVSAFDLRIKADSQTEHLRNLLDRYIFPSFGRAPAGSTPPHLCVQIEHVAGDYRLLINEAQIATSTDPQLLIPDMIQQLDEAIIPRLGGLRAVHAGAVQIGNRALILPGRSHAGKSSLVAELLSRGAAYLSDEYALIDDSGRVHAYPRPILLRNGHTVRTPVLARDISALVASTPLPIGWIMELEYQDGVQWKAPSVSQSQGLMILLRHTPHALADAPDLVAKFTRAVAGAVTFTGHRMDAKMAADEILQLTQAF